MSAKSGKSSFLPILLVSLVVLATGAYFLTNYLKPVAKVETVISGEAVDAKPGSVAVKEEYAMEMKSLTAGRVLNEGYHLDVGERVKEGDVLVQLDTNEIQINIDQDKSELESAKQRIAVGSSAKYQLESAESDFTNTERLFKMGQISDSDYQKSRRVVETLKQQQALEKVRNEEDIATDETKLRTDELTKANMTIKAPFSGEISYVLAHPGDLISSGSPIVTIITTNRLVEAKISEEDFADIKPGQKCVIIFLPYKEWRYNGFVSKILPTADPETQRHLVDLTVTDIEPEKLVPGITGEVTIETGHHHAKAIIPRRALLNDNVYVVKDGKVELRPVKKGFVWLTGAEITEGLEPGEQVIVEDLATFREGDSVKVVELPNDVVKKAK
jgi:RND family efflux transporter MFP subunit